MSTNLTPQHTHLYYEWWACWDWCPSGDHDCYVIHACPVTRITAKRIYFRGSPDGPRWLEEQEMFVERAAIERDGDIYHRGMREILSLEPPVRRDHRRQSKSLAELRREMAKLHPDVGGDPDEFRAAYARYFAAKVVAQ